MTPDCRVPASKADWMAVVKPYQRADDRLAVGQLVNTFVPLALAVAAACALAVTVGAWSLLLSPVIAGLMVRVFIIQHDCGHGSFLTSRVWCDRVGMLCSVLTFTPYAAWRRDHAVHHATSGNLDHRGTGDIRTLTVEEYRALDFKGKLLYRLYRNPLVLFGIGPAVHFLILQRFPWSEPREAKAERLSIHLTNVALLVWYGGLTWLVGVNLLIFVILPAGVLAASMGVWLFYVQHQFDEAYWVHTPDWEYSAVALVGSSYYKLPKWLQWFTGNIGLHHVHHLSPRIPNYLLQQCHDENPIFHTAPVMTFWESLRTVPLSLFDEASQRLVSFRRARQLGLIGL